LAPAYDICYAYRPGSTLVSQHALSINGKRTNITRNDLLAIGKSIKNKKAADVIDEISNTISLWKTFADEVKVSPQLRDEIDKTLIRTLK